MPLYDCGHPDCDECQREFGPDRAEAITRRRAQQGYPVYTVVGAAGAEVDQPHADEDTARAAFCAKHGPDWSAHQRAGFRVIVRTALSEVFVAGVCAEIQAVYLKAGLRDVSVYTSHGSVVHVVQLHTYDGFRAGFTGATLFEAFRLAMDDAVHRLDRARAATVRDGLDASARAAGEWAERVREVAA